MTKYRLADVDLSGHYNPNQPRDSHGRWTSGGRVALKTPAYVVNGKSYDAAGHALALKSAPRGGGPVAFMGPNNGSTSKPTLKPMPKTKSTAPLAPIKPDIADVIHHSADLTPESIAAAKEFWRKHKLTTDDTDADNLSTDLGLDPAYSQRSIPELRKAIKSRKTTAEERSALKAELVKRVKVQNAVRDEIPSFTNRLTKRLEEKPADADIAPIIGETLAQHPRLGPLAHIWDRVRLSGYNFKKAVHKGEFTDELPRIIARNIGSVLLLGLALHFGFEIPGLGGG